MADSFPPQSLTITLGFDSALRIVYPSGKSFDLPKGDAEARLVEILSGFRQDLAEIRRGLAPKAPPPVGRTPTLTLEDLDL